MLFLLFYFFFPADDGIRAGHVTGVQTFALPISGSTCKRSWAKGKKGKRALEGEEVVVARNGTHVPETGLRGYRYRPSRSEERRVGKECRYSSALQSPLENRRDGD